jgi:hypothetical protein
VDVGSTRLSGVGRDAEHVVEAVRSRVASDAVPSRRLHDLALGS